MPALSVRPEFGNSLAVPQTAMDANALLAMLDAPGTGYTPELTEQALQSIRRRFGNANAEARASFQSDLAARGGTGSSTEVQGLSSLYNEGVANQEDAALQFMLGAADRAAEDRRFRVGVGEDIYKTGVGQQESALGRQYEYGSSVLDRENEQALADKYMTQLAQQQAEERKRRRRQGIATGLTTLAGAGVGAFAGGLPGAQLGANLGNSMGFLFS